MKSRLKNQNPLQHLRAVTIG